MGGNALKNTTTRRYQKEEYHELAKEVKEKLTAIFPHSQIEVIPAYANKPSYGDMDVLIDATYPTNIADVLKNTFGYNQLVKSGSVTSFDYKELQIDLIKAAPEEFEFSLHYYSYNDMGNLLGKMAHKFGVKYGHDGVWYVMRDGDYQFKEILLTRDPQQALALLKLDYKKSTGFQELEDMFAFVASSPFFSPYYFLLTEEQKNAADRVRENKRKTYQTLLTWLEEHKDNLPQFKPFRDKDAYLPMLFEHFQGFVDQYAQGKIQLEQKRLQQAIIESKFSSQKITEWTGLEGKELGRLMTAFSAQFADKQARLDWLKQAKIEEIRQLVCSLVK